MPQGRKVGTLLHRPTRKGVFEMLSKRFVEAAYKTRGNELCLYVRAEVMRALEERELEEKYTEEEYNELVESTMNSLKKITTYLLDTRLD